MAIVAAAQVRRTIPRPTGSLIQAGVRMRVLYPSRGAALLFTLRSSQPPTRSLLIQICRTEVALAARAVIALRISAVLGSWYHDHKHIGYELRKRIIEIGMKTNFPAITALEWSSSIYEVHRIGGGPLSQNAPAFCKTNQQQLDSGLHAEATIWPCRSRPATLSSQCAHHTCF